MVGVNTRFVSLYDETVFINNLKFSRFSRKKEELFSSKYPDWKVMRSKAFQKMCVRASRTLSQSLNPRDRVFIEDNHNCTNLTLYIILEPYTRKYGIKIIYSEDLTPAERGEVDLVASPLTLDGEVGNIIHQMFNGEKMEPTTSKTKSKGPETIYPLINIPNSWMESWIKEYGFTCSNPPVDPISSDFLEFLGEYVPDVRENMLKSTIYLSKKKVD